MSDYSQTTGFGPKDSLVTGEAEKLVLGADLDDELDAINIAIATKAEGSGTAVIVKTDTWTPTWTGFLTPPIGDMRYQLFSDVVGGRGYTIIAADDATVRTGVRVGSSGINTITNVPTAIRPSVTIMSSIGTMARGTDQDIGCWTLTPTGVLTLFQENVSGSQLGRVTSTFSASLTKGLLASQFIFFAYNITV